MPTLLDPNFRRSVVLLCEHSPEGSLGLVINRPTEVEVSTILNDYPVLTRTGKLYEGGPVAKNTILVLCRGRNGEEDHRALQDVFLAKDFEPFKSPGLLNDENGEVRCYVGYAGWSPGQLEMEVNAGAWHLLEGDSTLVFDADPSALWPEMMRRIGGEWAKYAEMPTDPSLN